jgi:hypothetical protein
MLIDGAGISSHAVQDDENKVCVISNRASIARRTFQSEPSFMIAVHRRVVDALEVCDSIDTISTKTLPFYEDCGPWQWRTNDYSHAPCALGALIGATVSCVLY